MWRKGIDVVVFDTTLQALLVVNGDHFTIFNKKPVLDTDIEIIGKTLKIKNDINIELTGIICKSIFGD